MEVGGVLATLGQVMVEVGADLSQFEQAMDSVTTNIENTGRQISSTGDDIATGITGSMTGVVEAIERVTDGFDNLGHHTNRYRQIATSSMRGLPDHLKPFADELRNTRREIQATSRVSTQSLDEMAKSVLKTRVGFEKMTSVSSSGKEAIKVIQKMGDVVKETKFAVLGFNRDATLTISSQESVMQLKKFQSYVKDTERQLEALRDAGDMGSYQAGMQVLNRQIREVDDSMRAVAKGGNAYISQLKRMGVMTEAVGNAMAISMEANRESFFNANAMLQAKATMSEKMMKNLARMDVRGLDQQILQLGQHLEIMAKQGSAVNVAIEEVGADSSMKDLNDQVTLINMGIMRMQALAKGMGIVFAGMTLAIGAMAMGANVDDVRKQQAEVTQVYKDALDARTEELYNFASLFENYQPVKIDKKTLMANLQGQVTAFEGWANNLKSLAKRGVSDGFIKELEKLGPQASGEIKTLTTMSDTELTKYVALWERKHKDARTKSEQELDKLKESTKKKVAELEKSLMPLGIAVEGLKDSWAGAFDPFIKSFSYVSAKIVDAVAYIGDLADKFGEANPTISKFIGWITYLATGLSVLLSPLAIGISRAGAWKVAFGALWMVIGDFVLGLLAVIGTSLLWATAITTVVHAMSKMWKNSLNLRNAVVDVWNEISFAFTEAFNVLKPSLGELGSAFSTLANTFLGDGTTATNVWQRMGDAIAKVIHIITPLISTVFTAVFSTAVAIIVPIVKMLITVFNYISEWWATHGTEVGLMVQQQMKNISTAIQLVAGFIQKIMPTIMKVVTLAFGIFKDVVTEVIPPLLRLAKEVFPMIASVVAFVFPLILAIISSIWGNIKGVIVSGINIILGIIGIFKSVFAGDWSAVWDNVLLILKNIIPFIWNLVNLLLWGKLLKGALVFGKGIVTATKTAFTEMWATMKSIFTNLWDDISRILSNMGNSLKAIWSSMKSGAIKTITGMKASISIIWNSLKGIAGKAFNAVHDAIMTPINRAKDAVLKVVQKIKDVFNGMKLSIPKISLPHIVSTTKSIMGKTVPWFDVKWNAKGNMFNGPSVLGGGQGVGEAGAEVVMPIERKRYMKPYATMVAEIMGDMDGDNSSGNVLNTFHIGSLVVREEADIKRIAEQLEKIQRKQSRAKGGNVYA